MELLSNKIKKRRRWVCSMLNIKMEKLGVTLTMGHEQKRIIGVYIRKVWFIILGTRVCINLERDICTAVSNEIWHNRLQLIAGVYCKIVIGNKTAKHQLKGQVKLRTRFIIDTFFLNPYTCIIYICLLYYSNININIETDILVNGFLRFWSSVGIQINLIILGRCRSLSNYETLIIHLNFYYDKFVTELDKYYHSVQSSAVRVHSRIFFSIILFNS